MQEPLKRLERSPSLYRSAQESIKAYIHNNHLKAGDPVPPETELARQLGISRNSVREAVKALESLGILETRHGSGLFVRGFSFDPLLDNLPYGLLTDWRQVAEILEVRRVIEVGFVEQTMAHMTPKHLARLRELTERMRAFAQQGQNFPDEDRAFHNVLFEPLGNQAVLKLLDVFWLTHRKASEYFDLSSPDVMRTYYDHLEILDAVEANDLERARLAIGQHYHGLRSRLQQIERLNGQKG